MAITAEQVKELREKTGVGMMECKKALSEAGGDTDKAIDYLRKKGLKSSASKEGRVATDGVIEAFVSPDGKKGILLEVNSETDFVAKNDEFKSFVKTLIGLIANRLPSNVSQLLALDFNGETLEAKLNLLISKIGEKISIRRFVAVSVGDGEKISHYIHLGSKIGVLVVVSGKKLGDSLIRDVAMHVAASHPLYLKKSDIPQEVLEKEKEIFKEQLKETNKPQNVLEKIIEGKISKFASEVCLNDQIFIKDPTGKKSVSQVLKELDSSLQVVSFVRYQVGEGMEKKKDDFVKEIASMASP